MTRRLCPVVFPEGHRTLDGSINTFRPGIEMMAARLDLPAAPVCIDGLFEVFSIHERWPGHGQVRVRFGQSKRYDAGTAYGEIAVDVEKRVRAL